MGRSSGSTHLARRPGSFAGTNGDAPDNSIARYLVGLSINSVVTWSPANAITPLRNKNPKQQDNLFEAMQHLAGPPSGSSPPLKSPAGFQKVIHPARAGREKF
jgi:hypothetical protein